MTKRAGPILFVQCAMAAAVVKDHFGVMEQNTNSMRTPGRASDWTCGSVRPGALSNGWVTEPLDWAAKLPPKPKAARWHAESRWASRSPPRLAGGG